MAELSACSRKLEFHHGIARWHGKPAFLISADYPYFRRRSGELAEPAGRNSRPWYSLHYQLCALAPP